MRHLRRFPVLIALALIGAACSTSSPGASTGPSESQAAGASQGASASQGATASQGAGASQPAASTGGGGGGGGANGSIRYEITGDVTKSGELPFVWINGAGSAFAQGGWVAYFYSDSDPNTIIQINSNPASHIVNFGNGEILVIGTKDAGCTFDYSRNDSGGLKGTIDCQNPVGSNVTSGTAIHVTFHATVDAHT